MQKFNGNVFCSFEIVLCGQADRQMDMVKLADVFLKLFTVYTPFRK
jgi:hypothetical protein